MKESTATRRFMNSSGLLPGWKAPFGAVVVWKTGKFSPPMKRGFA